MNAIQRAANHSVLVPQQIASYIHKGKLYSRFIGITTPASWYPPLILDEEYRVLVHKTMAFYDNVFEPLDRENLLRSIGSAPEKFNFIGSAMSPKEEEVLLRASMRTLEPISTPMLDEIFKRCREHSKYFPKTWMLRKERDVVVGQCIQIYQRLAILECVAEFPSEDDTITKTWHDHIRSVARRKHGSFYKSFIYWEPPKCGSFLGPE